MSSRYRAWAPPEGGQVKRPVGRELVALGLRQILLARVNGTVEHGVVAHADLVGLLEYTNEGERVAAAHVAAHGDADGVVGVCGAAQAEQAAAEEQVRQRAERNRRTRLREAAQLVIGEPDPVAGGELRSQQPVFFVDVRVVVATGEVVVRCANLGRVLGDVRVDPAVVVLLLQLPAAVHHFPRAAHSEARRDGVEIPALAVVALDQPLGLAVEFIRCDEEVVGRETVDAGQARDHAHVAAGRLVEELLGRDRAAGGERQAGRRAAGQEGVEEVPAAVRA